MKKISYWSDIKKEKPAEKWAPVGLVGRDDQVATENANRNGLSLVEMTGPNRATVSEGIDPDDYESEDYSKDQSTPEDDIIDLLVFLGDEMDKNKEHHLANFADFMLKKIAETKSVDYNEKFNELMLKINNSDITDRNETIKKLANIFSRTLVLEHNKVNDIKKAGESAYKKTLHRANQYLAED